MSMTTTYQNSISPQQENFFVAAAEKSSSEIDLSKLLYRVLDKLHLMIIGATICGLLMGFFASRNNRVEYTATAHAFLAHNIDGMTSLGIMELELGNLMKEDYVAAFSNRHVHEEVIRRLELPYTPEQMQGMVSASYSDDSHLIQVFAFASTEQAAIDLANTYVMVTSEFFGSLMQTGVATMWEAAEKAAAYETMPPGTFFRYGVFAGAILVMVLVILDAVFDSRIRIPEEIEKPFGVPVIGVVTKQKKARASQKAPVFVDSTEEETPYAYLGRLLPTGQSGQDMLHTIAANLQFTIRHKNVIAITSCGNRDGKTYLTMQLGRTLAEAGKRVVILDGDFRHSTLRKKYNICCSDTARSMEQYISGNCEPEACICKTNIPNLSLVQNEGSNANPAGLIGSPEFAELIQILSEEYDLVLIDTPNAGQNADAASIIHNCDGVVLVTSYGKTTHRHVRDVLKTIEITRSPIVGAVINKVKFDCVLSKQHYWLLRYKN